MNTTMTEKIAPIGPVPAGSTLTVCDPCYLTDSADQITYGNDEALSSHGPLALAAITEATLAEGTWEAYVIMSDEGGWGKRVAKAGVRLIDGPQIDNTTESDQGVDAGMVGFFINRPALDYQDTFPYPHDSSRMLFRGTGLAWVTSTGFGDGFYPVTAYWSNGTLVAVEAVYIEDGEDEG